VIFLKFNTEYNVTLLLLKR